MNAYMFILYILTVNNTMKRKFIHDVFLDKENLLLQNIIANSKEGTRRKLKSIDSDRVKMGEVRSKSRDRYRNIEE